jgi:hypothetical protein
VAPGPNVAILEFRGKKRGATAAKYAVGVSLVFMRSPRYERHRGHQVAHRFLSLLSGDYEVGGKVRQPTRSHVIG